ncbi:hypothetical protein V8E53_000719 [Lactarius tabidus]
MIKRQRRCRRRPRQSCSKRPSKILPPLRAKPKDKKKTPEDSRPSSKKAKSRPHEYLFLYYPSHDTFRKQLKASMSWLYCDFIVPPGMGKVSLGPSIACALSLSRLNLPERRSRWHTCPEDLAQALCKAVLIDLVIPIDDRNDGRGEIDKVGRPNAVIRPVFLEVLYPLGYVLDAMIDVHLRLSTCVQKKDEPSASIAIMRLPNRQIGKSARSFHPEVENPPPRTVDASHLSVASQIKDWARTMLELTRWVDHKDDEHDEPEERIRMQSFVVQVRHEASDTAFAEGTLFARAYSTLAPVVESKLQTGCSLLVRIHMLLHLIRPRPSS